MLLLVISYSQNNQVIDCTKTNCKITLEKTPEYLKTPILKIPRNKKVEVIEYLGNEYWKIKCKNHIGYVLGYSLIMTDKMNEVVKNSKEKVRNEKKGELEKLKKEHLDWLHSISVNEEIRRNERKKELEKLKKERLNRLHYTFTDEEIRKIEDQEIWIGMTTNAAIEMFGYPSDNNRSTGSWGVHEQWVYKTKDMYLYFENGKLTSWQD